VVNAARRSSGLAVFSCKGYVTFGGHVEGHVCMSLEINKSVARVATIEDEIASVARFDQCIKRVIDIVVATVGLILFTPVFLLASLAISIDSPGLIFIREALPGCNNKPIRVFKFRVAFAAGNRINPRMTRVGQILTLTGIDELPQLINVLRGEMSIVGRRNFHRWRTSIL